MERTKHQLSIQRECLKKEMSDRNVKFICEMFIFEHPGRYFSQKAKHVQLPLSLSVYYFISY
jgi:hypothetical protein